MTELEQCTLNGWGKSWGTQPLWNKSGTPDYGRSNLANDSRKWRESQMGIDVRVSEKVVPYRYNLRYTIRFKYLRNTTAARIYGEPDNCYGTGRALISGIME